MSVVASLGDTVLYKSDLLTLSSPEYITDNVISLFLEMLNEECGAVYSIPPSVVQLIKLTDTPSLVEMLSDLKLSKYEIVLCPVNDSRSTTSQMSGQHWSLLCYVQDQSTVYHIDSLNSFNAAETKIMASKLSALFGKSLNCKNLCCAQQDNGYDCGIYVIFFARQIVKSFELSGGFDVRSVQKTLPKSYRSNLISDIETLPK
jgi:hypothetical protein